MYGRPRSAPKHRPLDVSYEATPVTRVHGFIRFCDNVLMCESMDPLDGTPKLGFISSPVREGADAFATIARATQEKTGLELSHFGIAQFVVEHEGEQVTHQVITGRAFEGELGSHVVGARFMPLTDVLSQQHNLCHGVPELIARVATMTHGFDKFVQTARKQAGALALVGA